MVIPCVKPCKKKRSTMLTVEQMVDIALGTPEIGAVNFNVLHALIHVIIQQLNIQKCLVEFKGYDSERMEGIILSAKPGPILKLSEYMIDTGDGKPCPVKEKSLKKEESEIDGREPTGKKPPCECMGKRKKPADEEKEKTDKGKDEDEPEKKVKAEVKELECEEVEEPEPKKVREVKKSDKKSCPCKGKEEGAVAAEDSLRRVPSSYYGSDSEGTCQTIVRVEPVGERCDSWRSRPALAHESMVKLEEKVAMLQDAFEALEQMPTNEELKKRTQGTGVPSTPVKDLWQIYNLNKRVESCEGTIEKLASMIEDLVKETCNFREAMLVIADTVDEMECADHSQRGNCCAALQGQSAGVSGAAPAAGLSRAQSSASKGTKGSISRPSGEAQSVTFARCDGGPCPEEGQEALAQAQGQSQTHALAQSQTHALTQSHTQALTQSQTQALTQSQTHALTQSQTQALTQSQTQALTQSQIQAGKPIKLQQSAHDTIKEEAPSAPEAAVMETVEGMPPLTIKTEPLSQEVMPSVAPPASSDAEAAAVGLIQFSGIGPEFYKMSASQKFCLLKESIECIMCQVKNLTTNLPVNQIASKLCALVSMQRQLDAVEKEWRAFLEAFGNEGVSGLTNSIKNMREDMENLNNLISKLIAEKQELDATIRNILQDIETLKRVKADLENVEDLLAEKADASVVNRKVSHDQFDAACDDLTRGLDEALEKLMQQEALWNEAMEEIHKDMDNKLDKNEIMPLKEFINKKLKCLQEKLKQLAQLRKDAEAAGAKSRILRNLNCIACDGDVVMKMDNMSSYQKPPLPPSRSMKPMLSFELDQVRKAMKKGLPCRASSHAEEAIADVQKKAVGIPLTTREAVDYKISKLAHLCNRYCGGSHTITTPQQRVTRIGHFLTEFGPQALAMFNQEALQQGLCPEEPPVEDLRKSC